jgi:hypothetical protein
MMNEIITGDIGLNNILSSYVKEMLIKYSILILYFGIPLHTLLLFFVIQSFM